MAGVEIDLKGLGDVQFGDEIRQKEFCLRPHTCILNNGSYGTVPRRVLDVQKRYLDEMESHPDAWFRKEVSQKWREATAAVAEFVDADAEDVVLVTNATAGVNCVLRSLKLKPGDAILGTSLTYHSMKNLLEDLQGNINPQVETLLMEVKLPIISEDDLVQQYDRFLTQHPQVKFVLVDHITSPSGIVMPIERVAAVCRRHGALVMVDGAHAPGQLSLHLRHLDVDFYTGNMHKWVYTPRGCALLWVRREHQSWVSPPSTSSEFGKSFSLQFLNQGTRDHIPFFCAKQALQFYQAIGGMDKVVGYISDLATKGRDLLATEVGMTPMAIPPSLEAPNLRLLKMPGKFPDPSQYGNRSARDLALQLQAHVLAEEDVQTIFDVVDGEMYLRISPQVHNTIHDFHRLVAIMKRFRDQGVPYGV